VGISWEFEGKFGGEFEGKFGKKRGSPKKKSLNPQIRKVYDSPYESQTFNHYK